MKNIIFIVLTVVLSACACKKGDVGETGAKGDPGQTIVGPQGPAGSPGINGQDGHNGTDATPVTVIELCPGVLSYPGVFVEVALCLQGQLYGVYSTHGGFLTLLPPGNYRSNAVGSACDLTILPDCVVSH